MQESRVEEEKDKANVEEVTRGTSARPKGGIRKSNRYNAYFAYANHYGAIVSESYTDAIKSVKSAKIQRDHPSRN